MIRKISLFLTRISLSLMSDASFIILSLMSDDTKNQDFPN